jgi:ubiquinone/menaquinone biosynthesis C-methylase UbiE
MAVNPGFSEFRRVVEAVGLSLRIAISSNFREVIRDELSELPDEVHEVTPDTTHLRMLYELRSQYLDWELGTGYLGMFAQCPGTRYTFTRRIEALFQILPQIRPDFRILEVGCGAGLLSLKLAPLAKLIIGIDISQHALNFANCVKEHLQHTNVMFQKVNAEYLAFQDRVFDLVLCSEVLEHLPAPERALQEMRRVLKDSGRIVLSTPAAVSPSDLCMALLRQFNPHLESEKSIQFDKRTYLAIARTQRMPGIRALPDQFDVNTFLRIHQRFAYKALLTLFRDADLEIERTAGAVFAFPPHYQVFYRYCPGWLLSIVRDLEQILNRLRMFQRFGAVTTCFQLKPL